MLPMVACLLALSLVVFAACGGGGNQGGDQGGGQAASSLNGAGATFPAPIYQQMFQQFAQSSGIQVNYQAVGSGAGIQQFTNKTVDFGASDAPMTDEQMQSAGGDPQHIATVGGAVVATYNLEGVQSGLNLEGQTLADIFQGRITRWNDPAIAQANPGVNLPDADIAVVHRSDGSGTTNIFSSYLSAVSPNWKSQVGAGTELSWPVGIGAKGNDGVSGEVSRTPNTIGYVELAYATQNNLPFASIQNADGEFVEPNLDSAGAAIQNADIPDDLRVTISSTNPGGSGVYPITGLTWLLVRQQQDDLSKCQASAQTAWYVTHDGQSLAPDQNYVQIPDNVVSLDEEKIRGLQANGQNCYQQ
jgi:phosphate transport system substrate-binding protein